MPRRVKGEYEHEFLPAGLAEDGVWACDCAKITLAVRNIFNRASAAPLEMSKSIREARKFPGWFHVVWSSNLAVPVRSPAYDCLLARAIRGSVRRNEFRRHSGEYDVLDLPDVFDAFEYRPAIIRGTQPRLFVGKPFG
jgi:hypothetical protein